MLRYFLTSGVVGAVVVMVVFFIVMNSRDSIISEMNSRFNDLHSAHRERQQKEEKILSSIESSLSLQAKTGQDANEVTEESEKPKLDGLKKVISFGLYGSDPKYTFGALRNAELAIFLFPGWVCRYYVDDTVPEDALEKLKKVGNTEIIKMPTRGRGIDGMYWRFYVADDPTVDIYIVRDADSRLNLRDKSAVDEWLTTEYGVHILRDHPNHNFPFNGGMWGGRKGAIKDLKKKAESFSASNKNYLGDMSFLGQVIWPEVKNNQMSHDSFHCEKYPNARPFPIRRFRYEHVGQVFDQNDIFRDTDIDPFLTKNQSPSACRKEPDWILG